MVHINGSRMSWKSPVHPNRSHQRLHVNHVKQAHLGTDMDFLMRSSGTSLIALSNDMPINKLLQTR